MFSDVFFYFSNRSFMCNKFGFFRLVCFECSFFLLLLLASGDVYAVAAADSGFVVVLPVLTR
jgi:hypothetical protein